MKLGLTIVSYFLIISSFAQDWKILNDQRVYFYSHSDSLRITNTIKVDSVSSISLDSVYYVHTRLKICDTCGTAPPQAVGGILYNGFAPEFLGSGLSYFPLGYLYNFDGNIIKPYSELTDSWLFNVSSGITATVVSTGISNIFGTPDSVKIIPLSTTDTIVLSKNNGLLRYPDFENSGTYFELVGFHNNKESFGEFLPNHWTIYDFSAGDVFDFYLYRLYLWDEEEYYYEMKILEDLSDSLNSRFVIKLGYNYNLAYGINWPETATYVNGFGTYKDTIELFYNKYSIENQYSGILMGESNYWPSLNDNRTLYNHPLNATFDLNWNETNTLYPGETFRFILTYYNSSIGEYIKYDPYFYHISDSVFYQVDNYPDGIQIRFRDSYGRYYQDLQDFETKVTDELSGSIINGDTTGLISGYSEILATSTNQLDRNKIFPNPTIDYLHVNSDQFSYQIYDLMGRIVQQEIQVDGTISVINLEPGTYIIRIISSNDQESIQPFIKQ